MGVAEEARDVEALRAGLRRWLADRHPRAGDLQVAPLAVAAEGLSSETYFADVTGLSAPLSLVVRLPPVGGGLFPDYDIGFQSRVQVMLSGAGIPVARPVAYVDDRSWVGSPFLVMPRVAGRIAANNPPYHEEGWLHDATAGQQHTAFTSVLDVLADIHRLDTAARRVAERPGGAGLEVEIRWWSEYLQWASAGSAPLELSDALEWCRGHVPHPEPPPSMLWGDARLGNVIFGDDFRPSAVLDWEMASVGPAELDLGWFFALRPSRPELPGFLSRDAALAYYEQRFGREVGDLWWYELFALIRSAAVLVRMQRLLVQQGHVDHWLAGFDPVPRRVKEFVRDL